MLRNFLRKVPENPRVAEFKTEDRLYVTSYPSRSAYEGIVFTFNT